MDEQSLSGNNTAVAAAGGATDTRLLTRRVADAVRDMIIQDEIKAGERIRERTLAQRLNVSRTPLRESLKILATEGLVELLPNRGAVVVDPSAEEIHDMLRVLAALEALAGELACARASEAELAEIKARHYEMLADYARGDRLAYFKRNQSIHLALVAASKNKCLIETHARINAQLYRVRYRSNLQSERWHTAIEEHELILKHLMARDAPALAHTLGNHLDSTWEKVAEVDHLPADA